LNREHIMKIQMVNSTTKDIRTLTTEFDWVALLSVFIFGIPHFLRGLAMQGWIIVGLNVCSLVTAFLPLTPDGMLIMSIVELLISIGVAIVFGLKGSEQYAKSLLVRGYGFQNPDGELAQAARTKWSIAA
jgi:hypothetical protein